MLGCGCKTNTRAIANGRSNEPLKRNRLHAINRYGFIDKVIGRILRGLSVILFCGVKTGNCVGSGSCIIKHFWDV